MTELFLLCRFYSTEFLFVNVIGTYVIVGVGVVQHSEYILLLFPVVVFFPATKKPKVANKRVYK